MASSENFEEFYRFFHQPKLTGRPDRFDSIQLDDVINLKIALALDKDVLEFLEDQNIFSR